MNPSTLLSREHWLSPFEKKQYNKMKNPIMRQLRGLGIDPSPCLALRIHDLILAHLYLHRAEAPLYNTDPQDEKVSLSLYEALARHRERLRKAIKELDDSIQSEIKRNAKDKPQNFVDYYTKLLQEQRHKESGGGNPIDKGIFTCQDRPSEEDVCTALAETDNTSAPPEALPGDVSSVSSLSVPSAHARPLSPREAPKNKPLPSLPPATALVKNAVTGSDPGSGSDDPSLNPDPTEESENKSGSPPPEVMPSTGPSPQTPAFIPSAPSWKSRGMDGDGWKTGAEP